MSVDPEQGTSTEPEASLDPSTDESGPDDQLGDAGTAKEGSGFTNPIGQL